MNKILKILLCLFFFFGISQPIYSLVKILINGQLFDYNFTYLRAASAFLSGVNIYSFGDINYPPIALFVFIPLKYIPVFWGQILFSLFSICCLVFSVIVINKALKWKVGIKNYLILFPLIFLSFPSKWTLGLGQVNNIILLLMALFYYYFQKKKFKLSGFMLGLAVSLKLVPGLLILYLLIKREFKTAIFAIATFILSLFISGLFFGFNLINDYFTKVIPEILRQPGKGIYYNQAFSGFINRVLPDNNNTLRITMIFIIFSLTIAFFVLSKSKNKQFTALGCSLIISTILLSNSFSWQHHFIWLVFPYLFLFHYFKKGNFTKLKILTFGSYLLVAVNIKISDLFMGNFWGNIILSHVFIGNLMLWLILLYLSLCDIK